jgi:hypothetical protein
LDVPQGFIKETPDGVVVYSGRVVRPLRLRPEDVTLADVARSLSQLCRFTGMTRVFYSVAEHSVHVCNWLEGFGADVQLAGLLHDATEAYMGDMAGPTKKFTPLGGLYKLHEDAIKPAIEGAFGLGNGLIGSAAVKTADVAFSLAEGRALMPPHPWHEGADPELVALVERSCWPPEQARSVFLETFNRIAYQTEEESAPPPIR